jgi:hypothetical protein
VIQDPEKTPGFINKALPRSLVLIVLAGKSQEKA